MKLPPSVGQKKTTAIEQMLAKIDVEIVTFVTYNLKVVSRFSACFILQTTIIYLLIVYVILKLFVLF